MLDIRLLRENPDDIKTRVRNRGGDAWQLVDSVLECDVERRRLETDLQALQQERNTLSKEIGRIKREGGDADAIQDQVRGINDKMKAIGEEKDAADQRQRDLLLQIPNVPHTDCPVGADEESNPEVRVWGEKPSYDFEPLDHVELTAKHDMLDFDNAAKIAGSGYVIFKGDGARLERALIQFLLDVQTREHGYTEVSPPFLINRDCMFGTGQLPKFEDDMYGVEENSVFLAPTAEVPVTNIERENLLAHDVLPKAYTAYTPCFRREAGSAGRDNKGLIRMHQFDKVEIVRIERPERSEEALEELTGHAEAILQKLGLHYRLIELCTGDIGFSATKTYDIEVWAPGHGKYLEVSSCSNFGDYQARRMNLRFKDENKKNRFCHTLNGSGTALPRLYVALVETYQQADGTIRIPEALVPYFGAEQIG
ncbi:serine--tRNA ligase [Sulfuriroseicoccus oceanibius]|uniref:Serine--tRNA ligase n=1 Tax=Sulfuriroseicoccus oceanibius TaxID=2707525 RepID=A0A6B3LD18_9BACT|nr:serine--tRNA ligase [Sulfuriroseicoccus oceanibius]QQL45014.1 serine--tRNA ligase [Sulfuriroseicoccus oceanibius]